ncbi:MAG: 1-acyl-sn-glycerol-3-phosphate acyltransferase [Proteobacteria bacterium]|nr:1-acyl-sn-glycerol-3-phosphate acyltransferase [Pseudomonadota bacterium]
MLKLLADLGLKLTGWTVRPMVNVPEKCIIIGYPHTSNWDFIVVQAVAFHFGIKLNWLGKKQLFPFPFAGLMRWLGGISVDRSAPQGLVQQVANAIRDSREPVRLIVPPEGTRSKVEHWKSGFYRIALAAGVPIQVAEINFEKKYVGFGTTVHLTGDVTRDMDMIRAAIRDNRGKFHENASPVRLREEDEKKA